MTLKQFCKAVNDLGRAQVARLNRKPNRLFGAQHFEFPESMLEFEYKQGTSPEDTFKNILEEAGL